MLASIEHTRALAERLAAEAQEYEHLRARLAFLRGEIRPCADRLRRLLRKVELAAMSDAVSRFGRGEREQR